MSRERCLRSQKAIQCKDIYQQVIEEDRRVLSSSRVNIHIKRERDDYR